MKWMNMLPPVRCFSRPLRLSRCAHVALRRMMGGEQATRASGTISAEELSKIRECLTPRTNPTAVVARFFEQYVAVLEQAPVLFDLLQQCANVDVTARDAALHVGKPAHVVTPAQSEPQLTLAPFEDVEDRFDVRVAHTRFRDEVLPSEADDVGLADISEQ